MENHQAMEPGRTTVHVASCTPHVEAYKFESMRSASHHFCLNCSKIYLWCYYYCTFYLLRGTSESEIRMGGISHCDRIEFSPFFLSFPLSTSHIPDEICHLGGDQTMKFLAFSPVSLLLSLFANEGDLLRLSSLD